MCASKHEYKYKNHTRLFTLFHRNVEKEKINTGCPAPLTTDMVQRNGQRYHNPNKLKMDVRPTALFQKNKLFLFL